MTFRSGSRLSVQVKRIFTSVIVTRGTEQQGSGQVNQVPAAGFHATNGPADQVQLNLLLRRSSAEHDAQQMSQLILRPASVTMLSSGISNMVGSVISPFSSAFSLRSSFIALLCQFCSLLQRRYQDLNVRGK
jgi:hypothetical protein